MGLVLWRRAWAGGGRGGGGAWVVIDCDLLGVPVLFFFFSIYFISSKEPLVIAVRCVCRVKIWCLIWGS